MPTPPKLTPEQRNDALAKSTAARQVRAAIKARVKTGELALSAIFELATNDEAIAKMRVVELLESFAGVGKVRAIATLDRLSISQTRRVQGLGTAQRANLLREFPDRKATAQRGKLIVLSGPGGVGKSTVAKALRQTQSFWVSVSATTRTARHNEKDGVDYYFYSDEEFDSAVKSALFLEWAEFAGSRYGTPRKPVEDALRGGKNVLLEIEIAGARQVKERAPEAVLVFLQPPSWEELVSRLEGRGTDSKERRAARLALAQDELAQSSFFDLNVINERVEEVVERLIGLTNHQ
ncbi:MAG: guanylate kinase [Candidatus Planktophila sp.]|nr:guanylate kinase [Candidatus Planktophila sp.]